MDRWKRDRKEMDQAFGDACYDVWMGGGNPDDVDRDAIAHEYYDCYDRYETAKRVTDGVLKQEPPHACQ
jgi:hypothetical protein